ncbi:MAG: head-tail connector protein [Ilumatobacteraceae bacterium]
MSLTTTSAPAVEPVTTAEAKEYLRIDSSDDSQNAILAILIKAARTRVEEYLRRSLITRTYSWEMNGDDMRDRIEIPRPPVQSVTSLTIYEEDSAGVETSYTEAAENWQLVEASYLKHRNDGWEVNRMDRAGTLVYVAGYGDASTDIPADILMVIFRLLALWYERRGDENRDFVTEREFNILNEIGHHRTIGY